MWLLHPAFLLDVCMFVELVKVSAFSSRHSDFSRFIEVNSFLCLITVAFCVHELPNAKCVCLNPSSCGDKPVCLNL
jgi:hypothetical protein